MLCPYHSIMVTMNRSMCPSFDKALCSIVKGHLMHSCQCYYSSLLTCRENFGYVFLVLAVCEN